MYTERSPFRSGPSLARQTTWPRWRQVFPKSAWRKCGATECCSRCDLREAGFWTASPSRGWRASSIQEAGLRVYFQSPTIWELGRLLVTRAFRTKGPAPSAGFSGARETTRDEITIPTALPFCPTALLHSMRESSVPMSGRLRRPRLPCNVPYPIRCCSEQEKLGIAANVDARLRSPSHRPMGASLRAYWTSHSSKAKRGRSWTSRPTGELDQQLSHYQRQIGL